MQKNFGSDNRASTEGNFAGTETVSSKLRRLLASLPYSLTLIGAIFLTVWIFVYTRISDGHGLVAIEVLHYVEFIISSFFLLDYSIRLASAQNRVSYALSLEGLIDFLASVPFFIGLIVGVPLQSSWMRVLRLMSLARVLKGLSVNSSFGGVIGRVLPYALIALGIKSLLLVVEANEWWKLGTQFNITLGVIGFSLAVLMGAKLTAVNTRLFAIEDTICRIVGSMRDMWSIAEIRGDLRVWSTELERFLKSDYATRKSIANRLRTSTDELEESLERSGVGGPNTAGFHRDVAFLLHRATTRTPLAYDQFLRTIVVTYCLAILVGVEGVIGVVSTFLSVLVLGGVYFLVQDIDDPLGRGDDSFIDAHLDALEYWNTARAEE